MKYSLITLFLTCMSATAMYGQTQSNASTEASKIPEAYTYSVDSLAYYIDNLYQGDEAKLQAIYIWMTNNLRYNVYTTFSSRNEAPNEAKEIKETLRTREGVCRQFALLFTNLAEKMGIPAFVVGGYNKSKGIVMTEPHEWCAAKIQTNWYLYDPTFGMGYVANQQFIASPTMRHCQIVPEEFIKTHMPFDPMWQFLKHTYPFQAFDNGEVEKSPANASTFNFKDSIIAYHNLPKLQQLITTEKRVRQNGKGNRLIDYFLQLTQSNISVYRQNAVYNIYKTAIKYQNQGVDLINDFIRYRRMEFKPRKKELEVRSIIEQAEKVTIVADSLLHNVYEIPPQYETAMKNLQASINELREKIEIQKLFMEEYYATSSSKRNTLFRQRN